MASPDLIARMGGLPAQPNDLEMWPSLDRATPREQHLWKLQHQDGHMQDVTFTPRYCTTDMLALKEAAIAGVGLVQLPLLMLLKEIDSGSLIKLLPEWEPRREVIHLVFPSRRGMLPAVRALIDYLVEQYARIEED